MLLFRSEEHVRRWCEAQRRPLGAIFTLEQGWHLARAWYYDRLSPDWRRRSPDEVHAIFQQVGLTGDFWWLG